MEERLTDVEIKLAFLERLVAELDDVVRDLGARVDTLRDEIAVVRERATAASAEEGASPSSHEPPPHY